ncbi:MAG: ribosome silencing factor [Burkholderiaceae bacterium]
MELRKLQRLVVDALEDVKGQDIQVFNTEALTDQFDRVVLVSGTSNRQTRALASHVRDKVKAAGGDVVSIEGEETGEWVLIDLADIVVHVMQPAIRAYYNLEELWGGKPVRVKLGAPSRAQPAAAADPRPLEDEADPPRVRTPRPRTSRAPRTARAPRTGA